MNTRYQDIQFRKKSSLNIDSLSHFETRYRVRLTINGDEKWFELFNEALKMHLVGLEGHYNLVGEGIFCFHYGQDFTLWGDSFSKLVTALINNLEIFNREHEANLSYCFSRKLWWNLTLVEYHSNANEPFYEGMLDMPNSRFSKRWLGTQPALKDFVSCYFDKEHKRFLLKYGIESLVDEWNTDEANYICKLFSDEIRDTVLHLCPRHALVKRFKQEVGREKSLQYIHDERFMFNLAALAMLQIIKQLNR
ncbi:MAG: hypothetical protein K2Q14_04635 [Gammaproteobacteria bacterium]|nr:hypothetical protein [Gammaproteobacteria bacterium]MBY0544818.1 hypothetical protein [Gammaproteobacteria bacterium]